MLYYNTFDLYKINNNENKTSITELINETAFELSCSLTELEVPCEIPLIPMEEATLTRAKLDSALITTVLFEFCQETLMVAWTTKDCISVEFVKNRDCARFNAKTGSRPLADESWLKAIDMQGPLL